MSNVLVIDVGTQSMRGIIFDSKGDILAKEKVAYPPCVSEQSGYAEQPPQMYWQTMCRITSTLAQNYPELVRSVVGMSVDTFRDSVVLLDSDYNVLRNCILWSDQRTASTSQKMPAKQRILFGLVGMSPVIHAMRRNTRMRWVQQNEPQLWQKVRKVVLLSAYLTYKLTGTLIDSYASSMGHVPFDNKKKRWMSKRDLLFPVFDTPEDMMIPLCAPGDLMGTISAEVSAVTGLPQGLRVYACGSDKGCETLGVGAVAPNVAAVSFGTSATVQFSTQKFFQPEPFIPSYPAVLKGYYNPELQIYRGYWMLNWFKRNFALDLEPRAQAEGKSVEDLLNAEAETIPAGSEGLVLQPFWQGCLTTPEARGAIIGFADHTRAHLYRAIIEGIDYALREGLERMSRRGRQKIDYLVVSGGGSQSDLVCQIAADVFNLPVRRVQTYETSGMGAAMVTFLACGVFENEHHAVREMVHYTKTFTPDPQNAKTYDRIYKNVYLKMYGKLRKFYLELEKPFLA